MASYFKPAFINFFKELSRNNTTAWFNEHKKMYEQDVKIPFISFIQDFIKEAAKSDKSLQIEAKDAITRINRDIRFSKDKSPYKLHVSAIISAKGKKMKEYPGVYLELAADRIMIYGGAYMLDKEPLYKTRTYIAKHLNEFEKLISDKVFIQLFGEIHGDKNKVLATEFKDLLDKQPLLANKNFYYFAEISVNEVTSASLLNTMMKYYKAGKPLNDFLIKAIS